MGKNIRITHDYNSTSTQTALLKISLGVEQSVIIDGVIEKNSQFYVAQQFSISYPIILYENIENRINNIVILGACIEQM